MTHSKLDETLDELIDDYTVELRNSIGTLLPQQHPDDFKQALLEAFEQSLNTIIGDGRMMMFSKDVPVFNSLEEWMAKVAKIREIQRQEIRNEAIKVIRGGK